jgi:hypothetical protein
MPKYDGAYQDAKGRWYFKVWLGRDPLTGRQVQLTKRGFARPCPVEWWEMRTSA